MTSPVLATILQNLPRGADGSESVDTPLLGEDALVPEDIFDIYLGVCRIMQVKYL
jgi:hypothetical protein